MQEDLISTLDRFRKHPAYGSDEFAMDIAGMATFINGYETALLIHGVDEVGTTFNGDFTKYLRNKYDAHSDLGWMEILGNVSTDQNRILSLFFSLVDEFVKK